MAVVGYDGEYGDFGATSIPKPTGRILQNG